MASNLEIQTPPPYQEGDTDWDSYIKSFEMYFTCADINNAKRKLALLLYCGGKRVQQAHETLNITLYDANGAILKETVNNVEVEIDVYKVSVNALTAHFLPERNITYERNRFRAQHQLSDESSATFVTRLRKMAQTCAFEQYSADKAIIDQYIRFFFWGCHRPTWGC